MVGFIGLLFWKAKLRLDLRADEKKQRQQHRITEEFEKEKRRQDARDRHERLKRERDKFDEAVAALSNPGQETLWNEYRRWLKTNGLFAANATAYEMDGWHLAREERMDALIRATLLPGEES